MTILAKLLAKYEDTGGYIVYVFECLDKEIIKESPYLMCTRFPNWDHRVIDIGEVGYLNFKERIAGVDKWFDGKAFIPYRYDDIQFIRFIEKPKTSPNKFVI